VDLNSAYPSFLGAVCDPVGEVLHSLFPSTPDLLSAMQIGALGIEKKMNKNDPNIVCTYK
jgi:hypothetical protein